MITHERRKTNEVIFILAPNYCLEATLKPQKEKPKKAQQSHSVRQVRGREFREAKAA